MTGHSIGGVQFLKRFLKSYGLQLLGGLIAAFVVMLFLLWMASEVIEGETLAFDTSVREAIHQMASPRATLFFTALSFIGAPPFMSGIGIVICGIFLYLKWRRAVVLFLITMIGEMLLDITLKPIYARQRPEAFFDYALPSSFSFPSGHALAGICFFGIIAWLVTARMKNTWAIWSVRASAVLLIFFIGLSRVYLGVHYPTDIIAGWVTGLVWTLTVGLGDPFVNNRRK